MMKKITLLFLLLLTVSFGYSQDLLMGFEDGESGAIGESFGSISAPIIEDGTGTNTTKVLKIVANSGGEVWQGTNVTLSSAVDLTTTHSMTIDVKSATAITFLVKVNTGATEAAAEVTHNGDNTWQTLSFTFDTSLDNKADTTDGIYTNFVIHAYWAAGETQFSGVTKDERTFYVDNINGPSGVVVPDPLPATGAPTPTIDATDVISVYSDTYTSIYTDLNPGWGQATIATEIQIDGNNTLKYAGLNYQGIVYTETNVSAMTHIHLDYWTGNTTALKLFLIAGGENAYDIAATEGITTGEWVSVDIELSSAFPNRDLTKAIQFKTEGNGTIYLDNLYFWKQSADPSTDATLSDLTVDGTTVTGFDASTLTYDVLLPKGTTDVPTVVGTPTQGTASAVTTDASSLPGASTVVVTAQDGSTTKTYTVNFTVVSPPTVAATTPPDRNAADVVSIFSDAYTAISPINYDEAWCGAGAVTATTAGGDNVFEYNDKACQGIGFASDLQDVSGLTNMHVDLFISEGTDLVGKVFNVKIVYSAGGEQSFDIDINALDPTPVPGTWYSYDATVAISGSNIKQVGITSNLNNVLWYDNLYFWKTPVDTATDTTLSNLTVDGTTVTGFDASTLTYDVILPKGTTDVPTVVGTPTQGTASAVTTDASSLPGASTVLVTAQDGSTTETYTVNFTVNTNTECAGTSSDAQQGSFLNGGYTYAFETLGSGDVRLTFELLEAGAVGVVAWAWKESPFTESPMTVTGNTASIDLTGYSTGEVISYGVKFAWAAGGFGVTKYFSYTVGEDCGTLSIIDYEIEGLMAYPNPTNNNWLISTKDQEIKAINVFNVLGKRVLSLKPNKLSVNVDASNLVPGVYITTITTEKGTSSRKLIKN